MILKLFLGKVIEQKFSIKNLFLVIKKSKVDFICDKYRQNIEKASSRITPSSPQPFEKYQIPFRYFCLLQNCKLTGVWQTRKATMISTSIVLMRISASILFSSLFVTAAFWADFDWDDEIFSRFAFALFFSFNIIQISSAFCTLRSIESWTRWQSQPQQTGLTVPESWSRGALA